MNIRDMFSPLLDWKTMLMVISASLGFGCSCFPNDANPLFNALKSKISTHLAETNYPEFHILSSHTSEFSLIRAHGKKRWMFRLHASLFAFRASCTEKLMLEPICSVSGQLGQMHPSSVVIHIGLLPKAQYSNSLFSLEQSLYVGHPPQMQNFFLDSIICARSSLVILVICCIACSNLSNISPVRLPVSQIFNVMLL